MTVNGHALGRDHEFWDGHHIEVVMSPLLSAQEKGFVHQELAPCTGSCRVHEREAQPVHSSTVSSSTDVVWLLFLALPLNALAAELGKVAAHDVYSAVKGAVKTLTGHLGLRHRAGPEPAAVGLQDSDTAVRAILTPDLPEVAYDHLAEVLLGLERTDGTGSGLERYLVFDQDRGTWCLRSDAPRPGVPGPGAD